MMNDPLLHRYVTERSEPAYAELVRQHIDLVYSAALRQVNGDATAAQDVTQAVFTDLASKASRLLGHTSLTGWLYTSTRYLCAKTRRSEQRRVAREQEAYTMNQLLQSTASEPVWQELRPVLDEAMHDLNAADREAVLLRFFERRSLGEIGTRLGLTEEAARKRVARALDKLRAGLAKRGITSTISALTAVLAEKSVGAAPEGLAAQVSAASFAAAAATGGLVWALLKLAGLAQGKALIAGTAAIVLAGALVVPQLLTRKSADNSTPDAPQSEAPSTPSPASIPSVVSTPSTSSTTTTTSAAAADSSKFILHIVSDESGRAIYQPKIEFVVREKESDIVPMMQPTQMTGSAQGVCEIPIRRNTDLALSVRTEIEGFADTSAVWIRPVDATIPGEFTLRLKRAAAIGGLVVDQDGKPVDGATVQFKVIRVPPAAQSATDNPAIYVGPLWAAETTLTDQEGRWSINRFSPETITNTIGQAAHPDYPVDYPIQFVAEAPEVRFLREGREAQQQLMAGAYVFTLIRAMVLTRIFHRAVWI